jgi:hypothetical protein
LFGRCILSLRCHLFVQPAGASPCRPAISLFGRHILIAVPPSLQLADASPLPRRPIIFWLALPRRPSIFWPAYPIAALTYHILAGTSNCRTTIAYLGWCIQLPISAGASHRCAALSYFGWRCCTTLSYFGRCIPSPRQPIIFWPAHPIAAPPLPILAGASDGLFWLAHPIAVPTYHILAGTSNRCATIAYLGWCIPSPILAGASPRHATITYLGWHIPLPI